MTHALGTKQANASFPTIFFISELCPWPWIYIEGFCYTFSFQSLTWNASKIACKNMESTLAVVDSAEKQLRISAELKGWQDHWIGLYRDPQDTSRWLWIDSSRLCEGCGHWITGEPNNYKAYEGCVEMRYQHSGRWNDQSCSKKRRYICQKRSWYYSFVDKSVIRENSFIVINWLRAGSRARNFLHSD